MFLPLALLLSRAKETIIVIVIIIIIIRPTNTVNSPAYIVFSPVAIETADTWHHQAVELFQELGRRATIITGNSRETIYLFQQLSVALQKGN